NSRVRESLASKWSDRLAPIMRILGLTFSMPPGRTRSATASIVGATVLLSGHARLDRISPHQFVSRNSRILHPRFLSMEDPRPLSAGIPPAAKSPAARGGGHPPGRLHHCDPPLGHRRRCAFP